MKLVAITNCPTGIAHTYMAAEALEKAAEELGVSIKVETQGSIGVENELTPEDIREANAVIIASAWPRICPGLPTFPWWNAGSKIIKEAKLAVEAAMKVERKAPAAGGQRLNMAAPPWKTWALTVRVS